MILNVNNFQLQIPAPCEANGIFREQASKEASLHHASGDEFRKDDLATALHVLLVVP